MYVCLHVCMYQLSAPGKLSTHAKLNTLSDIFTKIARYYLEIL